MFDAYTKTGDDIISHFHSSLTKGLTKDQVEKAKQSFGFNELEAKKKISPWIMFFNQFKSFIIYILLFAVVLSFIKHEYVDAIVILIILFMNAIIGFVQEFKAEKAIDSLKQLSGLQVTVLRDGKEIQIPTKELVPGDIIFVEEGSKVPADARLLENRGLQVSESSLTGESVPVSKNLELLKGKVALGDQKNMIFSGTLVLKGKATAIVTGTGMHTEIGKIASMLNEVEEKLTPLQKKLDGLGQKIGIATLIICFIILLTGVFSEGLFNVLLDGDFRAFIGESSKWLLLAVALAVAAVPEGLPAIVTIALSIGVKKMVKRNVLIRHLPSVETLGETSVICSDKTGTLTKNEMTVRKLFVNNEEYDVTGSGYSIQGKIEQNGKAAKVDDLLFRIGALCNNAKLQINKDKVSITGDPTEAALLVSAKKAGVSIAGYSLIDEEPFDSVRKMMSTVYKDKKGKKFVYVKGAPEVLIKQCKQILVNGKVVSFTATAKKKILKQNEVFASDALRVLGFAYKPFDKKGLEEDLIFVGLQGMIDPPRMEVKDAVKRCEEAGVRVIMITGDNIITAQAVAKEIGIEGEAMLGLDFGKLTPKQQKKALEKTNIFARVEPAHKMRIVELLQKQGHIVAMTGDGVNDAPAIKKADLGIAMGKVGTDVAKESSEMILLDDNFTSIVNAVEEGRGIFTNIKKFVNYLLSCNLGEVFIIFFAVIFFGVDALPLTAIMLLWLNLVTDGLPALALSVDPNPTNLMKHPPEKAKMGIMGKSMMFSIFYVSILITAGVLFLFNMANTTGGLEHAQSLAFTAIIMFELIRLHTVRSEHKLHILSNTWLILAVGFSLFLQFIVLYTPLKDFFGTVPLGLMDWILVGVVGLAIYGLTAFTKPLGKLFGIKY